MSNVKDKLIISVANEPYEKIMELAMAYRKIELRLTQLFLTNKQILKIIDSAELVVITGIAELDNSNDFHKINFNCNQSKKIIIDCPAEKINNKNLLKYIENPATKKILSYHQFSNIEKIENIFPSLLKKMNTDINKYDIIKIAVSVENTDDENELFFLFTKYPAFNFILIPLGEKYQKSRIKSLKLGSKYMFCYVNNPITACQLHYEEYI